MLATSSAEIGAPRLHGLDRPADAGGFVHYVGRACADEVAPAYRQPTFALLGAEPGQAILDLGCGRGEDARALAALVGEAGRVVGVDSSQAMIDQARQRSAGSFGSLEYRLGEAERLDFADGTFDGCRAERLLSCLADPEPALAEMVRVARPGGRIVVCEPDWARLVGDAPEPDLAGRIVGGRAGAWDVRLPALFRRQRLRDVTSMHVTVPLRPFYPLAARFGLLDALAAAQEAGAISGREAAAWLDAHEWAGRTGRAFGTLTALVVAGQKR
ncbi:MAG TPA: methyltransferase domain-containing protein [Chloroflexota bacterium]